jgi:hypothetical protein
MKRSGKTSDPTFNDWLIWDLRAYGA